MLDHAYYKRSMPASVKNPAHRRTGLRAADAYFLHLARAKTLDPKHLHHVLEALRCPAVSVWVAASDFLKRLSGCHPEVVAALREIAIHGKENERQQLAMSLAQSASLRFFPRPDLLDIFTTLVNDKSGKVRVFAVHGVYYLLLTELLPVVRKMASSDPDPKARRTARFFLRERPDLFYTYWHETPLDAHLYVLRTPSGEKWILVRPSDVEDYTNPPHVAAELLATHKWRPSIVWDYTRCAPASVPARQRRARTRRP